MTGVVTPGARALFLSYDGLTDPLGQSQILPYLAGLSARGHAISLISMEKPDRYAAGAGKLATLCASHNIAWHPLRYTKRPPVASTVFDLVRMHRLARQLHAGQRFDIVHCRSYPAALIGLAFKRRGLAKFLFDMRGFWIDERLEAGEWSQNKPYFRAMVSWLRARERDFFTQADAVVSLTHRAAEILTEQFGGTQIAERLAVIPCCVDLTTFTPGNDDIRAAARARLQLPADTHVLAYLGSLGGNYLLDQMLAFFAEYRQRFGDAHFLFITLTEPSVVLTAAARFGIASDSLRVIASSREEVVALLPAADHAVAFKGESFSATACSPTKLGEMLAAGLYTVANRGVGDVEPILRDGTAGITVEALDPPAYRAAVTALPAERDEGTIAACRTRATQVFDLNRGVDRYDDVYRRLVGAHTA